MLSPLDEPPQTMRTSGAYLILVLIWSTTPLAVVVSLRDLNPIWSLSVRFLLAIVIARMILWIIRQPLPMDKASIRCYFAGTLGLFWAMLFTYLGAQYLPSGLISLIFGLAPLFAGLVGHFRDSKLYRLQWLGMLLSTLGLVGIFGSVHMYAGMLKGMLYILIGVMAYVASIYWLRYEKANLHPLAQTTGSLMFSMVGLIILLPFYWAVRPQHLPSGETLFALAYSAIFASVIAMLCYFYLINRMKPATLSLATVITPVLALILGAWLNHEVISGVMMFGIGVVMLGLIIYFIYDLFPHLKKNQRIDYREIELK
ncbi:MAG: EamA family transporter [Candidatus Saccharibacteria bacterium]|nr:EamA family transporter [Moraxellaceae bacterium]